jgi:predicted dehydrogenase
MSQRKLRVGVIGAGHLGAIHARLLRSIDDVQLVGIVDPQPEARRRVAAETQTAEFADHRELIGKIDAAIVAASTEHHYWLGQELAEAGIHLFLEKPMTRTVAEADALLRATQARKLVLQVGHVERFNPAFTTTAAQVDKPRYIEAVRASGYTGRSIDVGVVLDLMIHDIDLVLSLVRSEVVDVEAIGTAVLGPHEDMAHARLRFANGCIANLNASRTSFKPQRKMQIYADQVFAEIDFASSSVTLVRASERILRREIDVRQLSPAEKQHLQETLFTELLPVQQVQVEKRNAILDEQHDFVISIRTGQNPQVSGLQARESLAVAHAILASIAEQQQLFARGAILQGPHWNTVADRAPRQPRRAG